MTEPSLDPDPLNALAESFVARFRRGERPSLSEYIERNPELADRIRNLFPALVVLEELGSVASPGGEFAPGTKSGGSQVPSDLGEYRILREIGRGGMGIVYEAVQESLGRHVALKVLPFHGLLSPTYLRRFQREARAAARLHHTNIVPVFGVGEQEGIHYYAMQFILGQGLDEVLREVRRLRAPDSDRSAPSVAASVAESLLNGHFSGSGPGAAPEIQPAPRVDARGPSNGSGSLPSPDSSALKSSVQSQLSSQPHELYFRGVAQIGLQVAEAVEYAHGERVLHRDIKPSNLLLDTTGRVWVTDFGLAKADESDDLTSPGDILGTVTYMAPERFKGMADPRSDVYGLGITLYEMLTLRAPFVDSNRARLIDRVEHDDPERPSKIDSQIPRDLETIVLKAIAKDPTNRYQRAAELGEDLRRFLVDRPIVARRSSWSERAWRLCRRNPIVASLSFGIALMTLLLCIGSIITAMRLQQAATRANQAQRDAQEQLCDSLFVQAHASRSSGRPGQRLQSLGALERAALLSRRLERSPEEVLKLRNEAIACLALPDVELKEEWEGNPPGSNGLGFDARFERYAWSFKDEGIRVCRVADHKELLRLPTLAAERVTRGLIPQFSPDGRFLAVWYAQWTSQHPLEVWDLKASAPRPLITLTDTATQPEFSADGATMAIGIPDNSVLLFDLVTGKQAGQLALDVSPERLALHPDGKMIAVSSTKQSAAQVRDLASNRVLFTMPHPAGVQAIAWHPQGKLLATGCDDRRIYLWDGQSGQPRGVLEGHGWEVHDLAFSQSGDQLSSFGWDMTMRLWDVATRKQLWHLENIRVVSFRADARFMAAGIAGRQVRIWSCVGSEEFHAFHGPAGNVLASYISPDGHWVAAAMTGENVWFWDAWGRREVGHLTNAHDISWTNNREILVVSKEGRLLRQAVQGWEGNHVGKLRLGLAEDLFPEDEAIDPGQPRLCGSDHRLVAIRSVKRDLIQVFRIDGTATRLWTRSVPNCLSLDVSADGRWLAVGTQDGGRGVSIFEASSGKLLKELVIGDATPVFSPDGHWLITTTGRNAIPDGEACSLWRIDSWEKVRTQPLNRSSSSPAPVQISPDGSMIAVAFTMSDIRLMRPETFEEIATLTTPEPGLISMGLSFNGDGRYLAVGESDTVQVWDLQALRHGLRSVGLDWD
jgi:serine/threonine protein kinase/WD40 repeat protein